MKKPHHHDNHWSDMQLRVKTLESLLIEKGYVDADALDVIIETYVSQIGPRNGAHVVAKAWIDLDYFDRLRNDATAAIAELGYGSRQGEHMQIVENRPGIHNLVVCTLCSCYPWSVLGLPPVWYKSAPYRSRAVIEPRSVLSEFGLELANETKVVVWDSTSEMRYLVIPERPQDTGGWAEDRLAGLVTRDSMIGTGLALSPTEAST